MDALKLNSTAISPITNTMQEKWPKRVLFLSDLHIGNNISVFPSYQLKMLDLMRQYDHVVLNGDCLELFYVHDDYVKDLCKILNVLVPGKSRDEWRKQEFDPDKIKKGESKIHAKVYNMIHGGRLILSHFLEASPHTHLHLPLGNHEKVVKFKNMLHDLQAAYPNFEWHPEAIRIGDALVTHGHLPIGGRTDEQHGDTHLSSATKKHKWHKLFRSMEKPAHALVGYFREPRYTTQLVLTQLLKWDQQTLDPECKDKFSYSHNRQHHHFSIDWVKHVFIGHTHHRFPMFDPDKSKTHELKLREKDIPGTWHRKFTPAQINKAMSITNFNTGAMVEETEKDLGILEADLNQDGTITNVRPVKGIVKNKHFVPANGSITIAK